jgi:hypothetical protein
VPVPAGAGFGGGAEQGEGGEGQERRGPEQVGLLGMQVSLRVAGSAPGRDSPGL